MFKGKFQAFDFFDPAKVLPMDGDGGDGSGDGSQGDPPQGVTLDQMNKAINNAIAGLRKTDLPKAISASLAPLDEKLGTLTKTLEAIAAGSAAGNGAGGDAGGGSQGDGAGAKLTPEVNAKFKQFEATLNTRRPRSIS